MENIDFSKIKNLFGDGREKYLLLFAAGILMLIISQGGSKNNKKDAVVSNSTFETENISFYEERIERKLQNLIESIEGVKKCKVMITLKNGTEKVVQSDSEINEKKETGDRNYEEIQKRNNTLVLKDENSEYPYITKEIMPQVEGVVVVAKGSKNTEVKNEIILLVQALFDVETHKISIAEMK